MRAEFETLRGSSSFLGRLSYAILRFFSGALPAYRRAKIVTWAKRVVHYRPSYCRRVTESGVTDVARSPRVIVSLTSYPARIRTVHRVISALLHQTLKPDLVVLWLGEDKFPGKEKDLPGELLRLTQFGLTIGWCKDLRSYTKLIPALRTFPEDIIVTADDDTFYGPLWLERLHLSYLQNPYCVHSCCVLCVPKPKNGCFAPYRTWVQNHVPGHCAYSNFLLGYGGVLYPPHALDKEVLNVEQFQKLAPSADDIWFWAMAIKAGTKICVVPDPIPPKCDIYATQAAALANVNVLGAGLNDVQLVSVVRHYGLLDCMGGL